MLKRFRGEFLTLPNILTYARILLVPAIVWTYCKLELFTLSAVLVALSGLTDCLDGYIARHYNMVTDFGKIIDPIADKLTQISVVFCLGFRYSLMFWLTGLLVVKELFVGVMGFIVMRTTEIVDGAKWYGKIATIMFYLVTLLLLVLPTMDAALADTLIFTCLLCMIASLVLYTVRYSRILIKFRKQ